MWGDAQGAATLSESSSLSPLLLSVTGPAHIPLTDARWSDLLLHYDVLVHLDHLHEPAETVLGKACRSMARFARTSSNLACLSLHAARMVRDLDSAVREEAAAAGAGGGGPDATASSIASRRIVLVGKARATCGALNLLRILAHEVVIAASSPAEGAGAASGACAGGGGDTAAAAATATVMDDAANAAAARTQASPPPPPPPGAATVGSTSDVLRDAFTYRIRDASAPSSSGGGKRSSRLDGRAGGGPGERDSATELLSSVLSFVATVGGGGSAGDGSSCNVIGEDRSGGLGGAATATSTAAIDGSTLLTAVPEIYDAAVQCLSLLLVLMSTQLYRPMISSLQRSELSSQSNGGSGDNADADDGNFFLRRLMEDAHRHQERQRTRDGVQRGSGTSPGAVGGLEGFSDVSIGEGDGRQGSSGGGRVRSGSGSSACSAHGTLLVCLNWLIKRPIAPPRSIAAHYVELANLVAQHARGEKPGPDGMYETHAIVMARAPTVEERKRANAGGGGPQQQSGLVVGGGSTDVEADSSTLAVQSGSADPDMATTTSHPHRSRTRVFVDATKGVLHMSSTLLLLPFRLMSLALALFGHGAGAHKLLGHGGAHSLAAGEGGYDHARMVQLEAAFGAASGGGAGQKRKVLTNDVLWLTDSPLADMGSALFLLLANNYRATTPPISMNVGGSSSYTSAGPVHNPFRSELASLNDNRWESGGGDNSLPSIGVGDIFGNGELISPSNDEMGMASNGVASSRLSPTNAAQQTLSVNFESLFASFGKTLHTECGELVLYTLLQSSPIFAASVAVRSDLDTLVMPLLRTLYFSSTMTHQQKSKSTSAAASAGGGLGVAQNAHFRSQSQLYVILILLLIFSQDLSFGPDSFRRVTIPAVPWYRERHLKDISLGSVVLLTVLRAITFNLHRLHDPFLLSNCCAVLLNISPYVVGLHSYAAMRLASVTVSCMKKYTVLVGKNGGRPAEEGDIASDLGMYGETCRTLLQVVKHSIRARVVGKNLHLIYALVYLQTDFYDIMSARASPFKSPEVGVVMSVISQADKAIQEDGNARTAEQTMEILERSVDKLKAVTKPPKSPVPERRVERANSTDSFDSAASDLSNVTDAGEFTFTYEEEADPEIFFIPYVWEVITCALTASTLEWNKPFIQVFPLLRDDEGNEAVAEVPDELKTYAKDVSDAV